MKFFDRYKDIKFNDEQRFAFIDAEIERATINKAQTRIKIYIVSTKLIDKKYIYEVQDILAKEVPEYIGREVFIVERFELSDSYTIPFIYDEYKESMLTELLNETKRMLYQILKSADYEFTDDNTLKLVVDDFDMYKELANSLISYIKTLMLEKFGKNLNIVVDYREYKKPAHINSNENVIRMRVDKIFEDEKKAEKEKENNSSDNNETLKAVQEMAKQMAASDDLIAKEMLSDKAGTPSLGTQKNPAPTNKEVKTVSIPNKESKPKDFNSGFRRNTFSKKSDNPDVLYGREFTGDVTKISAIVDDGSMCTIDGQILKIEFKEIRNERNVMTFTVTDFEDTIKCKMFVRNDNLDEIKGSIKEKSFVKINGLPQYDTFEKDVTISRINGIMKSCDKRKKREDNAAVKRVELHCHTMKSSMDAVCSAEDVIKTAKNFGHTALAVTDNGNVQGFTDALHAVWKLEDTFGFDPEKYNFKVIYGLEAYIVDDEKVICNNPKGQDIDGDFCVFDIETTGFSASYDQIIEFGAVKISGGKIVGRFSEFVNPKRPIPLKIQELTHITEAMVASADTIDVVMPKFLEFAKGCVMVAHNADFDMSFVKYKANELGLLREFTYVDTFALARMLLPNQGSYKLQHMAKAVGIIISDHHRAVADAEYTAQVYEKFITMMKNDGVTNVDDINVKYKADIVAIKKMHPNHATILVKNEVGRVNLYRLVSMSNLDYFHRVPIIPKSVYKKYSEGLIIGSGNSNGELWSTIYSGRDSVEISRIAEFYDYFEVQPIENNLPLIDKEEATKEQLISINKEIVELGEKMGKLVVATSDAKFIDPEDAYLRSILLRSDKKGSSFKPNMREEQLYLRTTDEMLDAFDYLGPEKAFEVVVTNTNKIADSIEKICPVYPYKAPPVIENSDQTLRDICYNKAHSMYGENLPPVVEERLEKELTSIISNGYAVMYIIAQKLVWKSNEDGYLVGSRGSVGSSFVATMSGISEVNPLQPHYYCKKCRYSDFDSDDVKPYVEQGLSGCDMPDKICPVCGEKLVKDGFSIPFETFLGFKGDKEPDIDLNFSGEYQSKAHAYTEVIFGKGQTFRAGTIGALADNTAYGMVKGYYEDLNITKRSCEIERIAAKLVGVKRTTGQHPGGIVVLPYGEEIYKFTPVQHPADDTETKIITTHFDYHAIDHNLLKLDILGHDDPTMIRLLEDLTGLDAQTIPIDSKEVLSLFESTEALGITPDDIDGIPLGCLGVPEFGTDTAIKMLLDAQPHSVSDLIRLSGLAHGTDVWAGNARDLILSKTATLQTAICTRDDIMLYLIGKGLDPAMSFSIMESVRKGKVAKKKEGKWPVWKQEMIDHGVPDWYIGSCEKIAYMFPKAHAAAYVMMAIRVAYYKIFYPLAYYAAFFSIRADGFDYELMCKGKDALMAHIKEYKAKEASFEGLSAKEKVTLKDMKMVLEFYARGFEFCKVDLSKVSANRFQIVDGKIMPSLRSISGVGDNAANTIAEACKDGANFISQDDFKSKTKASQTVTDLLIDLGILDKLPETSQLSFADIFGI